MDTLRNSMAVNGSIDDVNELATLCHSSLSSAIDEHVPCKTKVLVDEPRAEWFNDELIGGRGEVRRMQRQWLHSKLEVHRQMFIEARSTDSRPVNDTKANFHRTRIEEASTKELFAIVDSLSRNKRALTSVLPDRDRWTLPDTFADYFTRKIEVIRSDLMTPSAVAAPGFPAWGGKVGAS